MTAEPTGPGRREARERALGLLYECETKGIAGPALLESLPLRPDVYAVAALVGIEESRDDIDALIQAHTTEWNLDRLPRVDRAILRLAVWELSSRPDVPTAVVIDEAVELAKDYSTERSSGFVNGVLDAVASEVRQP